MEAVKNRLTSLVRDAGTFVVDADPDLVANAGDGDLDESARRREAHCIVDDRVDRPREPIGLAHHDRSILAWAGEGEPGIAGFPARLPAADDLLDEGAEIDLLEGRASQLGIRARRFADVADQPVEPRDVLTHDRLQLVAQLGVLDAI